MTIAAAEILARATVPGERIKRESFEGDVIYSPTVL